MILHLKRSRYFFIFYGLQCMGAFFGLWIIEIFSLIKIFISLLAIIHIIYILNRYILLKHRGSIVRIEKNHPTQWQLYFLDGTSIFVNLKSSSVVTQLIIFLHFENLNDGQRFFVLLFPDSESKKKLKRLRAELAFSSS